MVSANGQHQIGVALLDRLGLDYMCAIEDHAIEDVMSMDRHVRSMAA